MTRANTSLKGINAAWFTEAVDLSSFSCPIGVQFVGTNDLEMTLQVEISPDGGDTWLDLWTDWLFQFTPTNRNWIFTLNTPAVQMRFNVTSYTAGSAGAFIFSNV